MRESATWDKLVRMLYAVESRQMRATYLYCFASLCFWVLAFLYEPGTASGVDIEWTGAAVNFVLIVPLWRQAQWAIAILACEALVLVGVIASAGFPPPEVGLAVLSALGVIQFLSLCSLWSLPLRTRHGQARRSLPRQ